MSSHGAFPETTDVSPLRFSLAEMPVPMVYATHRIIRECNVEFAALFGFEREELVDQSFARLYPKLSDFVRTGDMWKTHLPGGQVYYDERVMTGNGGRRFWCRVEGRSHHASDPFAQALYCFQQISRPVKNERVLLTDRQRQILTLVAQGKTNVAIAQELGLSRRTIESHRARIMHAAGFRNAAELASWFSTESS